MFDLVIFDDPVTTPACPAHRAAVIAAMDEIYRAIDPWQRGGAYRNRAGDLVTWDATADGSRVLVQTWPGE